LTRAIEGDRKWLAHTFQFLAEIGLLLYQPGTPSEEDKRRLVGLTGWVCFHVAWRWPSFCSSLFFHFLWVHIPQTFAAASDANYIRQSWPSSETGESMFASMKQICRSQTNRKIDSMLTSMILKENYRPIKPLESHRHSRFNMNKFASDIGFKFRAVSLVFPLKSQGKETKFANDVKYFPSVCLVFPIVFKKN